MIPAFSLSRIRLGDALKAAGRGGDRNRGAHARSAFVVAEIAVTLALVVASGLVVRSFFSLVSTPLGFDPTGVTTYAIGALPDNRYGKPEMVVDFHQRVRAKVTAIPGVIDATWSSTPPFSNLGMMTSFEIEGHPAPPGEPHVSAVQLVGASYFNVLRIPLVRGRLFNDGDRITTAPVMIVNETFAREFFGTLDVLGKRVTVGISNGDAPPQVRTIVGVAADTRSDYAHPPVAAAYLDQSQLADDHASLVVRAQPHVDLTAAVMATVPQVDPSLDEPKPRTMAAMMADNVAQTRISAIALSVLAAIALFLAIAGVYGVVSYSVGQRTQEFGIRMALGARAGHIIRSVLAGAGRLATIGVLVGLVLAAFAARVVKAQLYGVGEIDPLTYGVVVVILIAAALIAALIPAIRATRVDPMVALRYE